MNSELDKAGEALQSGTNRQVRKVTSLLYRCRVVYKTERVEHFVVSMIVSNTFTRFR
jgi:hypothetical protein